MLRRLGQTLAHLHVRWIVVGLIFWLCQLVGWICMMAYVEFFPNHLRNSILYTIQISQWSLVITCATAATATLGVLSTRHHSTQNKEH